MGWFVLGKPGSLKTKQLVEERARGGLLSVNLVSRKSKQLVALLHKCNNHRWFYLCASRDPGGSELDLRWAARGLSASLRGLVVVGALVLLLELVLLVHQVVLLAVARHVVLGGGPALPARPSLPRYVFSPAPGQDLIFGRGRIA